MYILHINKLQKCTISSTLSSVVLLLASSTFCVSTVCFVWWKKKQNHIKKEHQISIWFICGFVGKIEMSDVYKNKTKMSQQKSCILPMISSLSTSSATAPVVLVSFSVDFDFVSIVSPSTWAPSGGMPNVCPKTHFIHRFKL